MSGIKAKRCGRGHKWDGLRENGQRYCKRCNRIRYLARKRKLKQLSKSPTEKVTK